MRVRLELFRYDSICPVYPYTGVWEVNTVMLLGKPAVGQKMRCHPRNAAFLDAGCRNDISGKPLITLHFTHVWRQEPCRRNAGRWRAAWQRARETGFDQHWSLIFSSSLTPSFLPPFLPTILPLSSINKVNSWREMWGPAQNWRIEAANNGKNSTNILFLLWDIIPNKWQIQPETLKDG